MFIAPMHAVVWFLTTNVQSIENSLLRQGSFVYLGGKYVPLHNMDMTGKRKVEDSRGSPS